MTLRIISGNLKKKKLYTVMGMETRPTADRTRESVFNILSFKVRHAVVLDLYAGTGALGIEALSRGAESTVFIDMSNSALSVIKKNILACAIENRSKIIRWNVVNNLNCIRKYTPPFNLVFMDPPYNKNTVKITLQNLHKSRALAMGASVIVEHGDTEPVPDDLSEYIIRDQRNYGKTVVSFLEYVL